MSERRSIGSFQKVEKSIARGKYLGRTKLEKSELITIEKNEAQTARAQSREQKQVPGENRASNSVDTLIANNHERSFLFSSPPHTISFILIFRTAALESFSSITTLTKLSLTQQHYKKLHQTRSSPSLPLLPNALSFGLDSTTNGATL